LWNRFRWRWIGRESPGNAAGRMPALPGATLLCAMKNTPRNISTYIALLRGINVGGHKIIKMERLRKAFEGIALVDAATYVQSGNVVFKTPAKAGQDLAKMIEGMLLQEFDMQVPVIVRTAAEMAVVTKNNPFLAESGIDTGTLHVTFLSRAPEKAAIKGLDGIAAGADRFLCSGQEIYLHCPNGFAGTKLSINAFEKVLSVGATTRNWNTVNKLHEMTRS
jgi:uncharacterized protein (DUF1697 family)